MRAERVQKKQIFIQLMQVERKESGIEVKPADGHENYLLPMGGPFVTPGMITRMNKFVAKRGAALDEGRGITFVQRMGKPAFREA